MEQAGDNGAESFFVRPEMDSDSSNFFNIRTIIIRSHKFWKILWQRNKFLFKILQVSWSFSLYETSPQRLLYKKRRRKKKS